MAIKVRCSACGKSMRLPDGEAGRTVVCLACGTRLSVPGEADESPAAPAATWAGAAQAVAERENEPAPAWTSPLEELHAGVRLDDHRVIRRQRAPLTAGQK